MLKVCDIYLLALGNEFIVYLAQWHYWYRNYGWL